MEGGEITPDGFVPAGKPNNCYCVNFIVISHCIFTLFLFLDTKHACRFCLTSFSGAVRPVYRFWSVSRDSDSSVYLYSSGSGTVNILQDGTYLVYAQVTWGYPAPQVTVMRHILQRNILYIELFKYGILF